MVNQEILKIPKDWKLEPLSPEIAKIVDTPHYTSPKSKYGTIPIITTALCSNDGINYSNSEFTTYEEYDKRRKSIDPELEEKRDKYIMIKNGVMQKLLTGEIRLV